MKSTSLSLGLGVATLASHCHGSAIRITDLHNSVPVTSKLASRATPWQPAVGAPWQIVLSNTLDLSAGTVEPADVEIFDIDLYDNTDDGKDDSAIKTLHSLGKKVICYFSAGTFEPERPDADQFPEEDKGTELPDWPGEQWLRLSSTKIRSIMADRIALAAEMGCDAIDPDNVDGFSNNNGLGLTAEDSISFVKFLAEEASKHSLSIGLKNAGDIIDDVLDVVHFSVNEECVKEKECESFSKFIAAGKAVLHIEYPFDDEGSIPSEAFEESCEGSDVEIPEFSTVLKPETLDGWVQYCDGTIVTTAVEPEEED